MRLWHKNFISVLPREQLVAQWRELSACVGSIQLKGTPNHILVNKILNYDFDHFITYAKLIRLEMTKRGYKTMDKVWNKIESLKPDWKEISFDELYEDWHNIRYLIQCYFNIEEKYDCGGIDEKDFKNIEKVYREECNKYCCIKLDN